MRIERILTAIAFHGNLPGMMDARGKDPHADVVAGNFVLVAEMNSLGRKTR
jgi:hypothetical protein